ncbi:hypothetical protein E4T43_01175 [Aureobasidium subglaciale]|nr:hypothetical protein E4T43_01175 [Aureobasidium subglaciale]
MSAARTSDRIRDQKAAKEKEDEQAANAKEVEQAARAKAKKVEDDIRLYQGLQNNPELCFTDILDNSGPFKVRRRKLCRTKDQSLIGNWAVSAEWELEDFYPGQIIIAPHAYSVTDILAKWNPEGGEIAMTKAGPFGGKMRYMVVLWTTAQGLFCIPMFTIQRGFNSIPQERRENYVTMVTEDVHEGFDNPTPWAGHPIIMTINPRIASTENSSPVSYAELSRPCSINKFHYLVPNVGSLDGDEYLRLLSLFKLKLDTWLAGAFKRFDVDEYTDEYILETRPVIEPRLDDDEMDEVMQTFAAKTFPNQFHSKRAKARGSFETVKKVISKKKKGKKK